MARVSAKPSVKEEDRGLASACDAAQVGVQRGGSSVIDLAHLAKMTMGEKALQLEVLALFRQQAGLLLARMAGAPLTACAALAHTLAGSARGIGAWEVASAAQEVEFAARDLGIVATASAVQALEGAVGRAQLAIAELLATA